jgi:hypothetical protein
MMRLLLSRAIGWISARAFYTFWIRTSALTLVVWAAVFGVGDSWIAKTGLTFILVLLLVGGIFLLGFGIRDLIRNFVRFLHMRSENKGHSSL